MRRRPELARTLILAAVAALATGFLLAGTVQGAGEAAGRGAARAWHSVFPDRPKTSAPDRMIVVLSAPSVAERVTASPQRATPERQKKWAADVAGLQESLLAGLRSRGVKIEREEVYTHVLDGFSARLDARALAELERNPLVVGVYPVRAVYPAALPTKAGAGVAPGIHVEGLDGKGVGVALLDTGVDRRHPSLRGHVGTGFDLVADDGDTRPDPSPADPARVETHGTRMAGLVVAVAPKARIVPFRILGWEKTGAGEAVAGRGDVLLAALERAVDPNADDDTSDALPIALAPVVEPFAAFTDSPEARAVTGAAAFGTLVVAPSGNDGSVGNGFGSVAAPGSAPDALSVGALDTRRGALEASARVSVGSHVVFDEPTRLLSAAGTGTGLDLAVSVLVGPSLADPNRAATAESAGRVLGDFFDTRGVSRVAGRAALVPADGASVADKVANAEAAGAAALLVYGTNLPAGALDLAAAADLPVVALPGDVGRDLVAAAANRDDASIALGASRAVGNGFAGRVAPFSSGGLAFDGGVRPDVVAPGVGLATLDARPPGTAGASTATATGTSAAAAVVAGAAALVKQARPELTARQLRSALAGTAQPAGSDVTAEGAGRIDPAAAAGAELVVEPATLAFGRAGSPGWKAARTLTVTNVSARQLDVGLASVNDAIGAPALRFTAEPARLRLGPGASADVTVTATAPNGVGEGESGLLLVSAEGVAPLRVPWAVARRPTQATSLVGDLSLSNWEFAPSDVAPSVLAFRAGRADARGDGRIEPVGLLEVELWTTGGKRLGVIARLRDVLPGEYAFGLTGRGPDGKPLAPGVYVLRVRAQPVDAADGTPPSAAQTVFRIKESS
jgi:subtilisin family serine protease